MATYIFRLDEDSIIGHRNPSINNAVIPSDSVGVTKEVYDTLDPIIAEMRADARRDNPQYIDSEVVIPTDLRPIINLTFSASEIKVGNSLTITMTFVDLPSYSGTQFIQAFGELSKFDFVDGEATRDDVIFDRSGVYEFKHNAEMRVQNPQNVTVYK